jgi:acyl carrier protein
MSSDTEARIRGFIQENFMMGQDASTLSNEDSFLDSGIIDSTGVLELIGFLEDGFGIQVADAEMIPANLDSIANLVRFIASKQS